MEDMENFGDCRNLGQKGAAIQARMGHYRASNFDLTFQPRPNHARPSRRENFPRRKLSWVLAALLLAASGATPPATAAPPATINARSPSFADVSTAVNSANAGDTVVIPAGTAIWTSTLMINKGITLIGQTTTDSVAGTAVDKTIIQDNVPRGSAGTPVIKVQSVLGQSYRITGITFQPYSGQTKNNANGQVYLGGNSQAVRIDHCNFLPTSVQAVIIGVWGAIYGVADHNVFKCLHSQVFQINMPNWPNPDGSAGSNGDGSWAAPTNLGSEKFFFVEDNYIKNVTSPWVELAANLDSTYGGRWVFRHNHCYETELQNHGTEGGRYRGCRAREIYNNDFHYAYPHGAGGSRSGVTITHDNTWDGVKPTKGIVIESYRAFATEPIWGGGSGANPWDSNDTANGPFTENGFTYTPVNGLYGSGTAGNGSNRTTIVDPTKSWKPNQWVNFVATNMANNAIGLIKSNTSNALTVIYYPDGRIQPNWAAGTQYQIRRPLILLDQPGRGQSDLIAGTTTPINKAASKVAWPNNALEPTYSWNDKYTPTGAFVDLEIKDNNMNLQKQGRDYFNRTPMPSYTPYTYPHPLTSGLLPPSNLTITP
jgi:hypothetical protein